MDVDDASTEDGLSHTPDGSGKTSVDRVAGEETPVHKLLAKETRSVGVVSWSVYIRYFKVCSKVGAEYLSLDRQLHLMFCAEAWSSRLSLFWPEHETTVHTLCGSSPRLCRHLKTSQTFLCNRLPGAFGCSCW